MPKATRPATGTVLRQRRDDKRSASQFPKDSNLRLFAGQQRGALRCLNGVCKVFPDFTGARAELVLRF